MVKTTSPAVSGIPAFEPRLPAGVAERLGWYVYLYVDPRDGRVFYVGKGCGGRALAHFGDTQDTAKTRRIAELVAAGTPPRVDILAHGLCDEETAYRVEAAAIDLLGLTELTNLARGWRSVQLGRMTLEELIGYYAAEPVEIAHPVLLVRVNQSYRHTMSPLELLEVTRGIWQLGPRREGAAYAFAVFEGVVREVYEIRGWFPALTLRYETRDLTPADAAGRWELDGVVAPAAIRDLYRGRSVQRYLKSGSRSPTLYVNC